MKSVTVVGAGPVGCYVSYLLGKNGYKVTLLEEHEKIGLPVQCTGILTSKITKVLSMEPSFLINTINRTKVFSPDKNFADFNLNLLTRINDELGGNFSLSNFEHVAIYNENKNRIEMYLRSKVAQNVYISNIDLHLEFNKDELIHTENSYKYSIPQIQKLASEIGFKITKLWQDEKKYFVLALLSKI